MVKVRCPVCGGKGRVRIDFGDPDYQEKTTEPWGPHEKKPCPACNGTGLQEVDDSVLKYVPRTSFCYNNFERNIYPGGYYFPQKPGKRERRRYW